MYSMSSFLLLNWIIHFETHSYNYGSAYAVSFRMGSVSAFPTSVMYYYLPAALSPFSQQESTNMYFMRYFPLGKIISIGNSFIQLWICKIVQFTMGYVNHFPSSVTFPQYLFNFFTDGIYSNVLYVILKIFEKMYCK